MGTYYRVQFEPSTSCRPSQVVLDQQLLAFNQSLSTYIADSELSLLNQAPAEALRPIRERLNVALVAAFELWRDSSGAFDVTVGPLVNIWGFGPDQGLSWPPSEAAQVNAAASVGMQHIELLPNKQIRKRLAAAYIDLSAIAKGQAVDEIAEIMSGMGCEHFLVDIGGEVRVKGLNSAGKLWRVGIEVPGPGIKARYKEFSEFLARVWQLRGITVIFGGRWSSGDHVLDPRSGIPADNNVLSVTVVPQCYVGDAYATALMVLGLDAGSPTPKAVVAALILSKSADAGVTERYTSHMQEYLLGNPE